MKWIRWVSWNFTQNLIDLHKYLWVKQNTHYQDKFFLSVISLPSLMSITYLVERREKRNQSTILISILNSLYEIGLFGLCSTQKSNKLANFINKTKNSVRKKQMQSKQNQNPNFYFKISNENDLEMCSKVCLFHMASAYINEALE